MWILTRTEFAVAFAATVITLSILLSATACSLLFRDHGAAGVVIERLGTTQRNTAIVEERVRMEIVLSKYRYYRYGAVFLAALGVAGLLFAQRAWVHGVAAGFFLFVAAQVVIDQLSEQRASIYYEQLAAG